MLPADLREAARRNAAKKDAAGGQRLASRLSSGEKRGRKRMAEVAAVYDAHPVPRTPLDIVAATVLDREGKVRGPVAEEKWVTASVRDSRKEVVAAVFDEAMRRDPGRARTWVVLVDGVSTHQLRGVPDHKESRSQGDGPAELLPLCATQFRCSADDIQHLVRMSPRSFRDGRSNGCMAGDGATAWFTRKGFLARVKSIFLKILSDECRCTVNNAPDLQKASREPSSRSPKCCEL